MTSPLAFAARTPLRRLLEDRGARFRPLADTAVADQVPSRADTTVLAIADLSPLPRIGFKGRGTIPAMQARGILCEAKANQAYRQPDGGLCLVLAPSEVILLAPLTGSGGALRDMERAWRIEDEERTYPMPRQDSHAWFLVMGRAAPAMFAKLCAIDLRPDRFADLAIAQTSMAKMTAIISRADQSGLPAFHVLADSAAAGYFCSSLLDAAAEFGGDLVGLDAVERTETKKAGAKPAAGAAG